MVRRLIGTFAQQIKHIAAHILAGVFNRLDKWQEQKLSQ